MNALSEAVTDYLHLRRSLGYKLEQHGPLLLGFAEYLCGLGLDHVTIDAAVDWATLPQGVEPIWWCQRLGIVRGFAVHQSTIDPRTEVPPKGLLARPTTRRTPYLFAASEVASLMEAAGRLRFPLKAATYEVLIGLLASTGMRVGEAIRLDRDHVDLQDGVITVSNSKFGKSRRLPLHASTTEALAFYARRRDQLCPHPKADGFFVSLRGTRLDHSVVGAVFRTLVQTTGIGRAARSRPRAHDLRHSFAVETLTSWYRSGADVGALLPSLSTYMGHVNPSSTYWYLQAAPELLALAAKRLEGRP